MRFVTSKQVQLIPSGMLVLVDIAAGDVSGIVEDIVMQTEDRNAAPFVTISRQPVAQRTSDDGEELADTEQQFFQGLGISYMRRDDGFGGIATVRDTRVSTQRWSGNPRRPDYVDTEYTDDYVDCEAATSLA